MASTDYLYTSGPDEKHVSPSTTLPIAQATLLRGHPLITNIASWCHEHNNTRKGVKPTLAVVYFDTGEDADEYLYVKAVVAARVCTYCLQQSHHTQLTSSQAGINYTVYRLHPKSPLSSVLITIDDLNNSDKTHGILIQRPIPSHLPEAKIMNRIIPTKHIEEFTSGGPSNIALESLERLLAFYNQSRLLDLPTVLLGGENIITKNFTSQLRGRYPSSATTTTADLPPEKRIIHAAIVITEMNNSGAITPGILGSQVKLVVDLGFDPHTKKGDLDPEVLDMEGLRVVPTPGGVLPVLLWIMMERTIKAREKLEKERGQWEGNCCLLGCCVS
jgi:methylenetetrahydrofolate dehydrogenase (NADP+)/methenyltetrahydrofolate cyclohydrolase